MNETLRDQLLERQNNVCPTCRKSLEDLDTWAIRVDRYPIRGEDGGKYELDNTRAIHLECDWALEGNRPNSPKPHVLAAYRSYKVFQQMSGDLDRRIGAYRGQRKNTTVSPYISEEDLATMEASRDLFAEIAHTKELELRRMVRKEPEWKAIFKDAPGCTEVTAALLMGKVDISKADTVSALWRFLGFDHTEKKNPGKSKALKSPLYASVGQSAIRSTSLYRQDYDRIKAKYEAQDKKGHFLATNQVIKLWLQHLWLRWRQYAELPVTVPYAFNHLNHDEAHIIKPEDRGWSQVSKETQ
ncbi:MAG: hypothetical protein ACXABY_24650 [Candidatus Thorarchaeota archaeon]|jgi:hypothetical protein